MTAKLLVHTRIFISALAELNYLMELKSKVLNVDGDGVTEIE